MFDLIIFDCDGVLVDTELIQLRIMAEMVQELGGTLTEAEAFLYFRGSKMAEHLILIERDYLPRPLPATFEATMRQRWENAFHKTLEPIPGVRAMLDAIGLPKCVASNGPLDKMRLTLTLTGLIHHFDNHLFSAYEIGRWKPDPGLYLHAAQTMGVAPQRCAVIEDSAVGVQAAVAAGMTVYGFAEDGRTAELTEAGAIVFESMAQLPEIMGISESKK